MKDKISALERQRRITKLWWLLDIAAEEYVELYPLDDSKLLESIGYAQASITTELQKYRGHVKSSGKLFPSFNIEIESSMYERS